MLNIVVALIILLLIAVPTTLYYLDRTYSGKIYPNVRIAGVAV